MATIIDTDGNICLGQWFECIGSDNNTILLKDNKRFIVVTRNDYSIQNEYLDAGYDGKGQLIPVYKEIGVDDMYGYIDKIGNETIPLIYDHAWNFEDSGFAKVKRFGQFHAVDVYGNLYYKMPSSSDIKEDANMLTKEESIFLGFGDCFIEKLPVKEGDFWGLGSYDMEKKIKEGCFIPISSGKIESYHCDRILYFEVTMSKMFLSYRIGNVCTLIVEDNRTGKEDSYTFEAESIEPIIEMEMYDESIVNSIIIKNNRKYGIVRLNGEVVLPTEYDSIVPNLKHLHTYYGQYDTKTPLVILWRLTINMESQTVKDKLYYL